MRLVIGLWCLACALSAAARLEGFGSLKIPVGAREAGLGGCGVAAGFGPQAIALNPAASADIVRLGVAAAYADWLLDTHHQSAFAGRRLGAFVVGAGIVSFSAGRFEHRTQATDDPLGYFEPAEFTFYANVARNFGTAVQAGLTGRYFYSMIVDEDATGFGLDGGVRVRPGPGFTLGASVVDFGKAMAYHRDVFVLPTRARVGAAYDWSAAEDVRVTLTTDGSYYVYRSRPEVQAGMELAWREVVSLRAGYDFLNPGRHLSFGLGLTCGVARFDYALASLGFDLGLAHRFALALGR